MIAGLLDCLEQRFPGSQVRCLCNGCLSLVAARHGMQYKMVAAVGLLEECTVFRVSICPPQRVVQGRVDPVKGHVLSDLMMTC